jgi:hypothetical protein
MYCDITPPDVRGLRRTLRGLHHYVAARRAIWTCGSYLHTRHAIHGAGRSDAPRPPGLAARDQRTSQHRSSSADRAPFELERPRSGRAVARRADPFRRFPMAAGPFHRLLAPPSRTPRKSHTAHSPCSPSGGTAPTGRPSLAQRKKHTLGALPFDETTALSRGSVNVQPAFWVQHLRDSCGALSAISAIESSPRVLYPAAGPGRCGVRREDPTVEAQGRSRRVRRGARGR